LLAQRIIEHMSEQRPPAGDTETSPRLKIFPLEGDVAPMLGAFEVAVRCGPCHDQGRSAPTLAGLERSEDGRWRLLLPERRTTRRVTDELEAEGNLDPAVEDLRGGQRTMWRFLADLPDGEVRWVGKPGRTLELGSRLCPHRPQVRLSRLYPDADRGKLSRLERGKGEIYVY
jgi:hypothetical protein